VLSIAGGVFGGATAATYASAKLLGAVAGSIVQWNAELLFTVSGGMLANYFMKENTTEEKKFAHDTNC
jgi:hypothetical protein